MLINNQNLRETLLSIEVVLLFMASVFLMVLVCECWFEIEFLDALASLKDPFITD